MMITPVKQIHSTPNFLSKIYNKENFPKAKKFLDIIEIENVKSVELYDNKELKNIIYNSPQSVVRAFNHLITTKLWQIKSEFETGCHSVAEIKRIIRDLNSTPDVSGIMVKSLCALGAQAYVFETFDDKILKITTCNHFPDNRKMEDFDVPIYKQGKMWNGTYYYLEEKLSKEYISQKELEEFCKKIENEGFILYDVREWLSGKIKARQFGKDKDGRLYLCDPGCAWLPEEKLSFFNRIKRAIFELVNMVCEEMA